MPSRRPIGVVSRLSFGPLLLLRLRTGRRGRIALPSGDRGTCGTVYSSRGETSESRARLTRRRRSTRKHGSLCHRRLLSFPEVIVVIPVVQGRLPVDDLDDLVRHCADEVSVVRDQRDGALEAPERLPARRSTRCPSGSSVRPDTGRAPASRASSRAPSTLLAARQNPHLLVYIIALEQKGAEKPTDLALRPPRREGVDLAKAVLPSPRAWSWC